MLRIALVVLLSFNLSACSLFQSQTQRNQSKYDRYVKKSRRDQAKRSAIIWKEEAKQIPQTTEPQSFTVEAYAQ